MSDKNKRSEEQAMKTSELLPCPFCGGGAYLHKSDHGIVVYAEHSPLCYLSGTIPSVGYADVKTSIEVWNTRKPIDDIVERLEKKKDPVKLLTPSWMRREERVLAFRGYCEGIEAAIKIVKEVGA